MFRKATPQDIRPLAQLWMQAFPGERTLAERIRSLEEGRPYGGVEVAFVEEEDGEIIGGLKALKLASYVNGVRFATMGLAAVAVAPAARRRGLGARLCREALRVAHERGDTISLLYPFRPAFYRALGWGLVGSLQSHTFRPEALPDLDATGVRYARASDAAAIAQCYGRVAERSNGLLERSAALWAHLHTQGGIEMLMFEQDGVRGYMRVRFGRGRSPERRVLRVLELVAETERAYEALLAWLAAQRDQWRIIGYDATPDERFDLRLSEPRPPDYRAARWLWYPSARLIRGPMLRIVDVPGALAARRYPADLPENFTLELRVRDAELPENEGPWEVVVATGAAHVARGETAAPAARIETDAATLAQIFAGELRPSEAQRLNAARLEGAGPLRDRAFEPSESFRLLDELCTAGISDR